MQETKRVKQSFDCIAASCSTNGYCKQFTNFHRFVESYRGAILHKKFYFKSDLSEGWDSNINSDESSLFKQLFKLRTIENTIPIFDVLLAKDEQGYFAIAYYGYFPEEQSYNVKYEVKDSKIIAVCSGYNYKLNKSEEYQIEFDLPQLLQ